MERLTTRTDICCEPENDIVYYNPKDPDGLYNIIDLAKCVHEVDGEEANILLEISNRLAAYEDTGLTPERIRELQNAFNILFESERQKQQEIRLLSMEIAELRESNQALKAYAENIEADKDAQVEKLKLMETVLKGARTALELLHHMNPKEFCFVFEVRCAIDALLGGKE